MKEDYKKMKLLTLKLTIDKEGKLMDTRKTERKKNECMNE